MEFTQVFSRVRTGSKDPMVFSLLIFLLVLCCLFPGASMAEDNNLDKALDNLIHKFNPDANDESVRTTREATKYMLDPDAERSDQHFEQMKKGIKEQYETPYQGERPRSKSARYKSGCAEEYVGSGQAGIDYLNRVSWFGPRPDISKNGVDFKFPGKGSAHFSFSQAGVVRVVGNSSGWFAEWGFNQRFDGDSIVLHDHNFLFIAGKFDSKEEAEACAAHMKFLSPEAGKIRYFGTGPKSDVPVEKPLFTTRDKFGTVSFSWREQRFEFLYPSAPSSKAVNGHIHHSRKNRKYGVWMDMTIFRGEGENYPEYKEILIASPRTGERNLKGSFDCDNVSVHYHVEDLVWHEGAQRGTWGPGAPHFSGSVHLFIEGSPIRPRQVTGRLVPITSLAEAVRIVWDAAKLNSEKDTWLGTNRYTVYPDRIEKAFHEKNGRVYKSTHYYSKIYNMTVTSSSGWLFVKTYYQGGDPHYSDGYLSLGYYQGDKDAITRILLAVSYLAKINGRVHDIFIEPAKWRKRINDFHFSLAQEKLQSENDQRQRELAEQLKERGSILDDPIGSGWHGKIGDRPANLHFPRYSDKSIKDRFEIVTKYPSDRYNKNGTVNYMRTGNKLTGYLKIGNKRTGVEEGDLALELLDRDGGKALVGTWRGLRVRFTLVNVKKFFNPCTYGGL